MRFTTWLAVGAVLAMPVVFAGPSQIEAGYNRPELPDFAPPPAQSSGILPRVTLPSEAGTAALSAGAKIDVRSYNIEGSGVLSSDEIAKLTQPYLGSVTWSRLEELRDKITLAYATKGYVSSGAVIPDQTVTEGVLTIQVVEGRLADIEIETDGRFRAPLLIRRLQRGADEAVNVLQLEQSLQLLQQDERIRAVQARLLPGEQRGDAVLHVAVQEQRPYRFELELSNDAVPAVGAEQARLSGQFDNLLGRGDVLRGSIGLTEGLDNYDLSYRIPLNSAGTTLGVNGRTSRADIVEEPFKSLDIQSRTWTYGLELTHPVWRNPRTSFDLSFAAELSRSESLLLGTGFSFSDGPENGVSKISALKVGQSWSRRTRSNVFILSSTLSLGLDVLDATENSAAGVPDGQFTSLLVQAQWAGRLGSRMKDSLLVVRTDGQFTDNPLLGLEQFALGGRNSVRGYRANTLVRDMGVVSSVQLMFPVATRASGSPLFELGPFIDGGFAKNRDRPEFGPDTILGAGLSARLSLKRFRLEVDWGADLKDIGDPQNEDLQDKGIHIRFVTRLP